MQLKKPEPQHQKAILGTGGAVRKEKPCSFCFPFIYHQSFFLSNNYTDPVKKIRVTSACTCYTTWWYSIKEQEASLSKAKALSTDMP